MLHYSKQKELDADPRAMHQIELNEMLKADTQVCTILEKTKKNCLFRKEQQKFCEYININGWIQYNVKLSSSQLNKLKYAVTNQTRVTLKTNSKMLEGKNLPREWLLTTRQKTRLRNAFESSMSTDINLSKTQI